MSTLILLKLVTDNPQQLEEDFIHCFIDTLSSINSFSINDSPFYVYPRPEQAGVVKGLPGSPSVSGRMRNILTAIQPSVVTEQNSTGQTKIL